MSKTATKQKTTKLCDIAGPKGGRLRVGTDAEGFLQLGDRRGTFFPHRELLEQHVPGKGDRRRIRKALFRSGLRNAAFWSCHGLPF